MFYNDHSPPHFHAVYGDYQITVDIATGVVQGKFPKRALTHVLEWHAGCQQALQEDWNLARERKALKPIPPLE
jgi:hypothetical protein